MPMKQQQHHTLTIKKKTFVYIPSKKKSKRIEQKKTQIVSTYKKSCYNLKLWILIMRT